MTTTRCGIRGKIDQDVGCFLEIRAMIDSLARLGTGDGEGITALRIGQAGQPLYQGRLDRFGIGACDNSLFFSPFEVQVDPAQPDRIGLGSAQSTCRNKSPAASPGLTPSRSARKPLS